MGKPSCFPKQHSTDDYTFFWTFYTIWLVFISFHFYYVLIVGKDGAINIKELINTFRIIIIKDYLWIVVAPFFIKNVCYLSLGRSVLNKQFSEKEKGEIKIVFKMFGILVVISLFLTFIF